MVINTLRNLDQATDGVSDMTIPEQMPSFEDHIQRKDFSDKRRNFEKPQDNSDIVASTVVAYIHSDLTKKNDFYGKIMKSESERWYPGIRGTRTRAAAEFETSMFEEWKQNLLNMNGKTAVKKYGENPKTFESLKKLHNYLISGNDPKNMPEFLTYCFDGDDDGFDVAIRHLTYNHDSGGGWNYYSSKNEKVGLEQPIRADGRLYLNAEPMDTYDIAGKFVSACRESGLPYEFKINQFADRADAMVFYIDNGNFDGYFGILNKILAENPQIKKRIGKPPRLTEKVNDVIGYGDENGGMSYNDRMCTKFQTAIEQVSADQAAVAPSLSVQERAKVLYVNFHEQFITAIQEKLQK